MVALTANIGPYDVKVPIDDATDKNAGDWIQIDSEKLVVTSVEGLNLLCARGRGQTAPASHNSGATVTNVPNEERSALAYSGARIRRTTGMAGAGTTQAITYNELDHDAGNYYDAGSPTGFTLQEAGKYELGFQASFAADEATHESVVSIRRNGTIIATEGPSPSQWIGKGVAMFLGAEDYDAEDFFDTVFLADSGKDMSAGAEFWIKRVE